MSQDSNDLIERMIRGDASSFDDVVSWYSDDVLRMCIFLLGNREEAADVLQETLLTFVRRVRSKAFYGRNGSVRAFLMTCARNLCIDRLHQAKRHRTACSQVLVPRTEWATTPTPDSATHEARLRDDLEQAVQRLPEDQRIIFVLHELNGDSYSEIAEALQLTLDQVRMRLHRARKTLRLSLQHYRSES